MKKDVDFYKRMQEAKRLKKLRLEQQQLAAEFQVYPERFLEPIIVKPENEIKMDEAFQQLKDKLHKEHPTPQDKLSEVIQKLQQGI